MQPTASIIAGPLANSCVMRPRHAAMMTNKPYNDVALENIDYRNNKMVNLHSSSGRLENTTWLDDPGIAGERDGREESTFRKKVVQIRKNAA